MIEQFLNLPADEKGWAYNCLDCVYTREVGEVEAAAVAQMDLSSIEAFQQRLLWPVLYAMVRGVRVDLGRRKSLSDELNFELSNRRAYFEKILGHPLNPASPAQMKRLFYDDLRQPPILSKAMKGKKPTVTLDDQALEKIAEREPILKPLINTIQDYRTLRVFQSTFIEMPLDSDGRMRCSYNICGTETFRFSSSANAFGSGGNLQNIPSDKSKAVGKAEKRGSDFKMPNIRSIFVPDEGMTFWDLDLDRADLQVVVWEAEDEELKTLLRMGVDLHIKNGADLEGIDIPVDELIETHPNYPEHKRRYKAQREFAKSWIHGTNYGGTARTMAVAAKCSVHQSELMQRRWFSLHPGLKRWHDRTKQQLLSRRYVENKFGYRRYYFDRPDALLSDALAWVPQSTVACVINRVWVNIFENEPSIEVLLQVHDSICGQFPTLQTAESLNRLHTLSQITIPYDDPLVIPTGIKLSQISWGDVK